MEETVVVVQEAKMGQSIDSGRILGAAVETQKQQHCRPSYFFVSKLGVYSIHVRLTFGFPPFVVCVCRAQLPSGIRRRQTRKSSSKALLFFTPCVCVSFGLGPLLYCCCTAAVAGDE